MAATTASSSSSSAAAAAATTSTWSASQDPVSNEDSLLVDISDALSERDRVRFTVHTRTKLPQFVKQNMSVVRQHEEFIWLHDCLEDNDQYAGYIIPPPPPRPDFDSSREKLQRLGDNEASMSKSDFTKMKQELEAEYLAIFKKTVAMHEVFLQRLAAHEKFRQDNNYKVFLEYENELAVRCKSKKERLAGSMANLGKSFTDFVITTSQVAATTSASTSLLVGAQSSPTKRPSQDQGSGGSSNMNYNNNNNNNNNNHGLAQDRIQANKHQPQLNGNNSNSDDPTTSNARPTTGTSNNSSNIINSNNMPDGDNNDDRLTSTRTRRGSPSNGGELAADADVGDQCCDEQYFERERLCLALYYNSIKDTALQADRVAQVQKCVADNNSHISQQLIKLASIEVCPITAQAQDAASYVACPLASLSCPASMSLLLARRATGAALGASSSSIASSLDTAEGTGAAAAPASQLAAKQQQPSRPAASAEGLKQLLLHVSDYLEQARKIETRIASDEDLKLTDTFLYYKRETQAAQDLLVRRLRYLAELETAQRNLDKARHRGGTQMQYAHVIEKQARENFKSISVLARRELTDYKQRRAAAFKKAFGELAELELKHLRAHAHLIESCLDTCRPGATGASSSVAGTSGLGPAPSSSVVALSSSSSQQMSAQPEAGSSRVAM